VTEDILMLLSGPWSNRAFSPFPTLLHFEKSTLGRSVKSGCCAFHNSTALITTTSFIVVENDQTTVFVSMRMMFVEKKALARWPRLAVKAVPNSVHFHRFYVFCGLYTLRKSEYSTTAVEELRRNPDERTRHRTRGTSSDGIQRYKIGAVD
jgi:hypothetical protein